MSSCVTPGIGLLYTGVEANKNFVTGASKDQAGRMVYGEACSHSVLWLVAWGDAGLAQAMMKANPNGDTLKNIIVDHSMLNAAFGIYTQYCTHVTAWVVKDEEEKGQ